MPARDFYVPLDTPPSGDPYRGRKPKNFTEENWENFAGDARSSSRSAVWDGGVPNIEEASQGI